MSNIKRQLQRLQGVVPVAALVIPAAFVGFLILKYSVNLPQWDEWTGVTFLHKLNEGSLSLSDLFRQQNEYRQFFPNLVFVFLGRLTKFDVRYHMGVSLLLACITSFNIYRLGKLTLDRDSDRLWAYVAANLLIFSPVQHVNWLQGQQLIYFFPIACLSTCLVIATAPRLRFSTKCIACAALSIISTFSSVNGILCWPLVLPVLLTWSPVSKRSKRGLVIGWIAAIGISAVLYMYDYHGPAAHPSPFYAFAHPAQSAIYFFSVIGKPLVFFLQMPSAAVGFGLVALFVWICVHFVSSLSSSNDARRALIWLMLGAYSLLTAVLITIGRAGFGVGQSLSLRYTTFTLYLPLALVCLFTTGLRKWTSQRGLNRNAVLRRLPIAAMAIIVTQLPIYLLAVRTATESQRSLLQAKACVLFTNVIDDPCLTEKVYPDRDVIRRMANQAESLGLLSPGLIKTPNARDLSSLDISASDKDNLFVEVVPAGEHKLTASGRAIFPGKGQPPDAVLLAFDAGGGNDMIFGVAFPKTERSLRDALQGRGVDSSWRGTFDRRKLPAGPLRITAWGFDAETRKAYRLLGDHMIENTDSRDVR